MFPVAELESIIRLRLILLKTSIRALTRYKIEVITTNTLKGNVVKIGKKVFYEFFLYSKIK